MHFFSESFPSVASMQIQLTDLVALAARCAFVILVVMIAIKLGIEVAYLVHTRILKPMVARRRLKSPVRKYVKWAQTNMK